MPIQSLIWTALPNGLTADGKGLRLSVLVSPRLEPQAAPARLDTFADFVAWPKVLSGATFTVKLGTKTVVLGAANVDGTLGTPDVATWAALFPVDTFVRTFAIRDHTNDTVVSYDTVGMHGLIAGLYGKLTASATDELPTIADLRTDPVLGALDKIVGTIDRTFWDKKRRARDIPGLFARYRENRFKGIDTPNAPVGAFQLFHTPPSAPKTQTVTPKDDPRTAVSWQTHERAKLDAARAVKEIDFHQIVAAMNQYPTLLRRLGLVVDLIVPRTALTSGADLPLSVTVALPAAAAVPNPALQVARRSASPITRTRYTDTAFLPVSRPSPEPQELRVASGLLKTDADRFALLQADVDGAGHKLLNFVRSLGMHDVARLVDPVTKLPRRAGAPALRNAGLMFVHRQRGEALTVAVKRNATRNASIQAAFVAPPAAAPSTEFYAEDLIRGWRVDIWDATTKKWRSLCERVAEYVIGSTLEVTGLREETTVRLAATTSADGNNPTAMYLHEALTVWNGWSLAAQQPGLAVDVGDGIRKSAAEVPNGVRLRSTFVAAPGTLPRLRYGRAYAVRLRSVDLAANSLGPSLTSFGAADTAATAAPTPYLRFEPIQPPTLALVQAGQSVEAPLEGESMGRIAIRTFNDRFDDATPAAQVARRWLAAPRVSQREAELHGMLDGAEWGGPTQYALLSTRDRDLASIELALAGPLTDPGTAVPPATYAVLGDGATQLPYLPDPLCTRVAARVLGHPAFPPVVIEIPLYPDGRKWPDAAPIFVRVYEAASEPPRFDAPSRTLLVPLPKGVRAKLRLSAMLAPNALDLLGVWSWVPAAARTASVKRRAENGQMWPLTPARVVDLVHAVQRPLLQPTITGFLLERPLGATYVRPGVIARVHCASTDRIDLQATWHEPRDVTTATTPVDLAKTDVAFTVKITDPSGYAGVVEHVMADPKDPNLIAFGPVKPAGVSQTDPLPSRVHDFGDTKYRRIEYHFVGTSRFREYMPPSLLVDPPTRGAALPTTTDAHITLAGPVQRDWVLSSAPPPAPEILYIVPTFGWTRGGGDALGKRTSWRRGSGLRIWLDRPWNATGYGEMLGVVLTPTGMSVEPNDPPYKHTATQWGNDPIWKSPFVAGVAPTAANFPRARTARDITGAWLPPGAPATESDQPNVPFTVMNLPHAGLARGMTMGSVDVVPHDVFWDADRRLWYCDVEIDHGASYFPFVRLALARYQPSSLPGAHLSNVVLADFAALAPDHWLTVTRTSGTLRQIRVFGFSHEESSGHHEAWPMRAETIVNGKIVELLPTGISKTNVIEVWVEQLAPGSNEDFGWRRVSEGEPGSGTTAVPVTTTTKAAAAARTARARQLMQQRNYDVLVAESLVEATMEWPTLWSGSVTLPSMTATATRYRAVIAEYEEYLADDTNPYQTPLERKDRRLVFVEHVELT